jgi:xylose dehydrogenase (NAD/NADP)
MRFGILGTANIGRAAMIPAIDETDHVVGAIASRDAERAAGVAAAFDIPASYGSYEELLEADLDAVYVPLPNALHAEWTRRAADAGLDVLCEKPLTADAEAAAALFDYCADAGVTLMEGFMYRFHPRTERARAVVSDALGEVRSVDATFKFRLPDPADIRYDPELGGGALLDAGSYAVNAVRGFLGEPDRVYAVAADTRDSGVDTALTGVLEYAGGRTGRVTTSFDTAGVQRYRVECVDGYLEADDCFVPGEDASLTYEVDGREATETFETVDHYVRQVEHFASCAATGRTPRVDRSETVGNMRVLDALAASAETGEPVRVE